MVPSGYGVFMPFQFHRLVRLTVSKCSKFPLTVSRAESADVAPARVNPTPATSTAQIFKPDPGAFTAVSRPTEDSIGHSSAELKSFFVMKVSPLGKSSSESLKKVWSN